MANKHFGNLADVFKHVALAEMLGAAKVGEYWESHAGAPGYIEAGEIPAERLHGVHTFAAVARGSDVLRFGKYCRLLMRGATGTREEAALKEVPGSPKIARELLGSAVRRYLFCDQDAGSLQEVQKLAGEVTNFECVQDDGVTVLRGATLLLPEHWAASTMAFIDPYDPEAVTDAGITSFDLWGEIACRGMMAVLWYPFNDEAGRVGRHGRIKAILEKTRLGGKNVHRFEGSLKSGPTTETLWGFGVLVANVPQGAIEGVDRALRALEAAYGQAVLAGGGPGSGAFTYRHASL